MAESTAYFRTEKLKHQAEWPGKQDPFSLNKSIPTSWSSSQIKINSTHINSEPKNQIIKQHTYLEQIFWFQRYICFTLWQIYYISLHDVFGSQQNCLLFKVKQLHPSKLSWSIIFLTGQRQRSCKGLSDWFTHSLDPCPHANQRKPAQLSHPKLSFPSKQFKISSLQLLHWAQWSRDDSNTELNSGTLCI